jgi:two-component sensor histidine kinase
MDSRRSRWFWVAVWASTFPVALGLFFLYAWLPVDGSTGALESFEPDGYVVQWLLEEREGGLQPGDTIVRAGGHTVDEWLAGASRGPEWRSGGVVAYEILRSGQPRTLQIRLAPVPFRAILNRWGLQLLVALACFAVGTFVLARRPHEQAARLLMLFCIALTLQYWGDAYNFQYATLPWRWPFWIQLAYEHVIYGLTIASICHFALIFPTRHPLVERFPHLVPSVLYAAQPLVIAVVMALGPDWSQAIKTGSVTAWVLAVVFIGVAIAAAFRSVRTAHDPVSRAQIRWILWCAAVGCAAFFPLYILPLLLDRQPLLPHPMLMVLIVLIPFALAITILRYHLFDIEVIINRTLVYGTLSALLAGLYLLLVPVLTRLGQIVLHRENDALVTLLATSTIVLAFAPLRERVQMLIDHTFYRTKLDYQRLLPEISERLATNVVLDQLAALLVKELPQRLEIAWATLAVLDPEGECLIDAADGEVRTPFNHPVVVYMRQTSRPLLRLQPPVDLPAAVQTYLDRQQIELIVPLVSGDEQVGLYNLGPKLSGNAYNRDEMRLLHLVGQQAAIAVENSRLFQAEHEHRRLAEALQEAADVVSSTLDLDQVLDRILEQVEQVVGGDAFNIMLVEGTLARVVRRRGYERVGEAGPTTNLVMPIDQYPTLTQMARTGRPIVIADTANDPRWVLLEGCDWLRSYLSAPIRVAGDIVGFLNVDRAQPSRSSSADTRRLEGFARYAATALQNAQLYEQAQREIAVRRRAEEHLTSSLAEKEVLLKEIHHRVKNNLQVISSLLYLQSKQIRDQDTLEMFVESQQRVRSMALVHERLYQSDNLARVDCADYVRDLVSYLHHSYGARSRLVKLSIDVVDMSMPIDTAVPFGLIVNELTSNALKHAFPDGREGEIAIRLDMVDGCQWSLVVSDNGTGLPEGLDVQNPKTLGLQLVKTLTAQMNGTIDLEQKDGTSFRITFPLRTNGKGDK